MKAIRIRGSETLTGNRHITALLDYQKREKLTDDQIDAMIAAGEIEFGSMYWDLEDKALEFEADDARERVYTTLERMIEIGGR